MKRIIIALALILGFITPTAQARTLAMPKILDMCKVAAQANCIDSVVAISNSGVESKATLVSTPTVGFTIIGDGSKLNAMSIASPQPHFKIPGLINSDGGNVVEVRVFFAADPWVSFAPGMPLSNNPPGLNITMAPVNAKSDKPMANLKTSCTKGGSNGCGFYAPPLGDQVRIKMNLRLHRWSARSYQIWGSDIDVSGSSDPAFSVVSITARPAKGAVLSVTSAGASANAGKTSATAISTTWAVAADVNTSPQCRSGFSAAGGTEGGWHNGGEIPLKGMPRLVGMHFPEILGLDGAVLPSTLEFVIGKNEINCMWPDVSLADLAKNLRQIATVNQTTTERPIIVENLGDRLHIKLASANLLPGSNDGFAIGLSGDSDPSKWKLPTTP